MRGVVNQCHYKMIELRLPGELLDENIAVVSTKTTNEVTKE